MTLFKIFKQLFQKTKSNHLSNHSHIVPREAHTVSRKSIQPHALKVLYQLKKSGFAAYLVGGGVRDLLVNLKPKDFDVATDARPEQIKKLFHRCFLIGRRFRLAHVYFGREKVEVATFRANIPPSLFNKKN